jgi:MoxR-like ATPase
MMKLDEFSEKFHRLADNMERVVQGKREAVELSLTCLFAGGHLLVEDVPGVGKTLLARCLAASIDVSMRRIQFTPDLLPTDVTGTNYYIKETGLLEFREGPVFASVVLADEINRASPKTQSALLEVMEEQQVTFDGRTYPVPGRIPAPFMIIATQNPIEAQGTYLLPEAQLDRFLMRITIGYPDLDAERNILMDGTRTTDGSRLAPVVAGPDVLRMADAAQRSVFVQKDVLDYLLSITRGTRPGQDADMLKKGQGSLTSTRLGVSPRGSMALMRAARVRAASMGRDYVTPDDIRRLAEPVLAHRVLLTSEAQFAGSTSSLVVSNVLRTCRPPR